MAAARMMFDLNLYSDFALNAESAYEMHPCQAVPCSPVTQGVPQCAHMARGQLHDLGLVHRLSPST